MKKNAELPKLRIQSSLLEKIKKANVILNSSKDFIEISLAQFRRLALQRFSEEVKPLK